MGRRHKPHRAMSNFGVLLMQRGDLMRSRPPAGLPELDANLRMKIENICPITARPARLAASYHRGCPRLASRRRHIKSPTYPAIAATSSYGTYRIGRSCGLRPAHDHNGAEHDEHDG
jgi:hypothetical protein